MNSPLELFESQLSDMPPIKPEQLVTNVKIDEVNKVFDDIESLRAEGRAAVLGSRAVIHGSTVSPSALRTHYEVMKGQHLDAPPKSPEATLMVRGVMSAMLGVLMHGSLRIMGRHARRDSGDDVPDRVAEELAFHLDRILAVNMLFFGAGRVDPWSAQGKRMFGLVERSVALGLYKSNADMPELWGNMFTDSLEEIKRIRQKRKLGEHLGGILAQAYAWIPEREKGRLSIDEPLPWATSKKGRSSKSDVQPVVLDSAEVRERIASIKSDHTALIEHGRDGSSFRLGSKSIKVQGMARMNQWLNHGYEHKLRNLTLEGMDQSRTPVVLGLLTSLQKWTAENGYKKTRTRLAQLVAAEQSLGAQLLDAHGTHGDQRLMTTLQDAVQWMRTQREVIGQIIVDQEWPSADWQTRVNFAADLGMILGGTDTREGWDWLFSPKENMVSGD